jgi:alpha-tubulin suppressor-like RCC1 family protein
MTQAAYVRAEVDSNPTTTVTPGRLTFGTTNIGDSAVTEKMRITNSGNVGISTISPNERLTVVGNISATGTIYGDGTGLKNLDLSRKIIRFKNETIQNADSARSQWFISEDKRIYTTGQHNGPMVSPNSLDFTTVFRGFNEVPIPLFSDGEHAEQIYSNHTNTYILSNFKKLYSIGINYYSQLGSNEAAGVIANSWRSINLPNVRAFACPTHVSAAWWTLYNASPWWGMYPWAFAITEDGRLYGWGWSGGTGFAADVSVPTLYTTGDIVNKNLMKVITQSDQSWSFGGVTFVIDDQRNLYARGPHGAGQLGIDGAARTLFTQVPNMKADKVITGSYEDRGTTFVLDGTTLYSTGDNTYGQLGISTTTPARNTFQPAIAFAVKDFISGGWNNGTVAAIGTDDRLYMWGLNTYGQLGRGNTASSHIPQIPNGLENVRFKKVDMCGSAWGTRNATTGARTKTVSYTTVFALDDQGRVWTCGYNGHGQCGIGTQPVDNDQWNHTFRRALLPVSDPIVDISTWGWAGGTGAHAITTKGDLYTLGGWGPNGNQGTVYGAITTLRTPMRCLIN